MTNKDLINAISAQTGMSKKRCGELLDLTSQLMLDKLIEGNQVYISELGTFEVRHHKERVSVHPKTKQRSVVPAKKQLSFKQSASLKEKINQR